MGIIHRVTISKQHLWFRVKICIYHAFMLRVRSDELNKQTRTTGNGPASGKYKNMVYTLVAEVFCYVCLCHVTSSSLQPFIGICLAE